MAAEVPNTSDFYDRAISEIGNFTDERKDIMSAMLNAILSTYFTNSQNFEAKSEKLRAIDDYIDRDLHSNKFPGLKNMVKDIIYNLSEAAGDGTNSSDKFQELLEDFISNSGLSHQDQTTFTPKPASV